VRGALMAGAYAFRAGCATHPRNCGGCRQAQTCSVKRHVASTPHVNGGKGAQAGGHDARGEG